MSWPVMAALATVEATPSKAPRAAPSTALPPRPLARRGTKSIPPPIAPEIAPERAAPPVLPQSQSLRSPLANWMPWMAASMATSVSTSRRMAVISLRKIICTVILVAACAIGTPAVDAPNETNAAATSAAISMASRINAAMMAYFAYSTSSAQLSHESPIALLDSSSEVR
ncbi:MAG: hypothetical protein M3548_17630 [Actinomycetota bacterium]|nr:hypothetical protein [Actinomycetota bacterium]